MVSSNARTRFWTSARWRPPRAILGGDLLTRSAAVVLVVLMLLAVIGPVLPLGDPLAVGLGPRLTGPASEWPLGTDTLGRSLLPRVIEGMRTTILFAMVAVACTLIPATLVGLVAGYKRGLVDAIVVRVVDTLFSFPSILFAIMISAIAGPGRIGAVASVVLVTLPLMVRVVRAATLLVADRDFVVTAEVSGASLPRILFVHLLPNITGPLVVQTTYALSIAMLIESSLSYLGLGAQPPDASLGSLVFEGSAYLVFAPWLVFGPGVLLAGAILSVNLLGDGLRDTIDPRTQRIFR